MNPGLVSRRCLHVWRRNYDVSRLTWKTNVLPPLIEPLLYIFAFGFGLGVYVQHIQYQGRSFEYLTYLAPGMIAVGTMFHAIFECMYGSFVRMRYQKTFEATLCTPLLIEDILAGELLWGATKGVFGGLAVLVVSACFGLTAWPHALLVLPVALVSGLMFAGFGLLFAAVSPYIDNLNLPTFLFINPMFLFSGTFFPLDGMPLWLRALSRLLPLTHVADLMRASTTGLLNAGLLSSALYLLVLTPLVCGYAMWRMKRRLIK
ncbi:MAG: ABC transporter permease [Elusimicrobiota bacterium]|jgi:lipooligosaccharide transport system permease protein